MPISSLFKRLIMVGSITVACVTFISLTEKGLVMSPWSDPEKWMVIDGLQRISTIKSFFVEQTLTLKGLEFLTELNGKKCDDLPTNLQRTIEDTMFVAYHIEAQRKFQYFN
jgi:hypothetical protein